MRSREGGFVIVMTALSITVLLTFAAIVVDLGYARQYAREAQAAADAAALAGAQDLTSNMTAAQLSTLVSDVQHYAKEADPSLTTATWTGCSDAAHSTWVHPDSANSDTCIAVNSSSTEISVVVPTIRQPSFFGGVVHSHGTNVYASAVASAPTATVTSGPCGLCALATMQFSSSPTVTVTGTTDTIYGNQITMNANNSDTSFSPQPIEYTSSSGSNWHPTGCTAGPPNSCMTQVSAISDPDAGKYTFPNYSSLTQNGTNGCPSTWMPGQVYTQALNCSSSNCPSGSFTIPTGTYYFEGNVQFQNCTVNSGTGGVTFVFTGNGGWTFESGTLNFTAPTTGPYANMVLLADTTDTQHFAKFQGGTVNLSGSVYAPDAGLDASGSSTTTITGTVIVHDWLDNGPSEKITINTGGAGGSATTGMASVALVG